MDLEYHGLSESQFKFALFWANKRLQIKKAFFYIIAGVELILFIYVGYGLVRYFILERNSYENMMQQLVSNYTNFSAWHAHIEPDPLLFADVQIVPRASGQYDFVVPVENNNDDWMAGAIVYQFKVGETLTPELTDFVYPGQKKYLAHLGEKLLVRPSIAEFVVTRLSWQRVTNFPEYFPSHYNFLLENIRSDALAEVNKGQKLPVQRITFDVTNKTAFDFWTAPLSVLLLRGEQVIAMNKMALDNFLAAEKRSAQVNFFGSASFGASIRIIPEVNVYDKSVFRPLQYRFEGEGEKEIKIQSEER